jgi:sugar phosphate isomerase/epimerase
VLTGDGSRKQPARGGDAREAGSFADPGQGLLDFPRIFRHSDEAGVREYIVERDDAASPPRQPADALDTAQVGYQFLRTVRF